MTKLIFIVIIILFVITSGMFAADLFWFTVPEWVIYALLCIIAGLTVFLITKEKKKALKITSAVLTVFMAAASFGGIYLDPYFNSVWFHSDTEPTLPFDTVIAADKACVDIDYAMRFFMKLHPTRGNDAVLETAEKMKTEIKAAGSVTVNELTADIERAFSKLGDAHTHAYAFYAHPLYLKHYYKWKTGGWSVIKVGGLTMKDLLYQCSGLFSYEAESWELEQMKGMLLNVQGLDYLGFSVRDGIAYTFENEAGEQQSETYYPEDYVTYEEYLEYNGIKDDDSPQASSFVRTEIDEEKSLAVLTLDECVFNGEYISCLRDMFTQVKNKGIKNVAVDIRENGGGTDEVATEFIRYLDIDDYKVPSYTQRLGFLDTKISEGSWKNERYSDLTFHGDCFVLTSSGTFSSAMIFAQLIKDNGLGTLIGEPPGNDPNGFGEIACFRTPNAGVMFYISTKRFYRADRECKDKYVMPDMECSSGEAFNVLYEVIGS